MDFIEIALGVFLGNCAFAGTLLPLLRANQLEKEGEEVPGAYYWAPVAVLFIAMMAIYGYTEEAATSATTANVPLRN